MFAKYLAGATISAAAGLMMLGGAATTASAMPIPAPAAGEVGAAAQIDKVWYDRWGYWHPGPRYWGPGWGPGYGWRRQCWRGPWGRLHCRWVR